MIGGNLKNELGKRFAVSINNINTDDSGNIELPEANPRSAWVDVSRR